jgi:DNA invertase Pin-like site-specific DNA recombinase
MGIAASLTPAAQYLRMSTDEQKLSLAYQAKTIHSYARRHGFEISKTYQDAGRSGLTLQRRKGLTQLLQDVVTGSHDFRAVLVYDVSRWGRFQDTDESAHYEFLCRSAGVPIHYCAEPFKNSTSSPAVVMKTLKRVMAAEYSRELSERLTRSKIILTERGFRAGGAPGYGLRRMLLSSDGSEKRLLAHGEIKDVATGRVVLVPGPKREVRTVRTIYRLRTVKRMSYDAIAEYLNRKCITHPSVDWTGRHVAEILRNPKYAGWATWRRTTGPLGTRSVDVPRSHWIAREGAFRPLVDRAIYEEAQRVTNDLTSNQSDEQLLEGLRRLWRREGKLSQHLINSAKDVPHAATYQHRFGSLREAYALIGYEEFRNTTEMKRSRRRLRVLRRRLVSQLFRIFMGEMTKLRRGGSRQALRLADGVTLSVAICRSVNHGYGLRWPVTNNRFEHTFPTLICLCAPDNRSIKDMYLMAGIDGSCPVQFLITDHDPWLKQGKRIRDLSKLRVMLAETSQSKPAVRTRGGSEVSKGPKSNSSDLGGPVQSKRRKYRRPILPRDTVGPLSVLGGLT